MGAQISPIELIWGPKTSQYLSPTRGGLRMATNEFLPGRGGAGRGGAGRGGAGWGGAGWGGAGRGGEGPPATPGRP